MQRNASFFSRLLGICIYVILEKHVAILMDFFQCFQTVAIEFVKEGSVDIYH